MTALKNAISKNYAFLFALGFQIHFISYLYFGNVIVIQWKIIASWLWVFCSIFAMLVQVNLILLITSGLLWLRRTLYSFFIFLQYLLFHYHSVKRSPFDWNLFLQNRDLIFYQESWDVISSNFNSEFFRGATVTAVVLIVSELWGRKITRTRYFGQKTGSLITQGILFTFLLFIQDFSYNPFQQLVIGAFRGSLNIDTHHPIFSRFSDSGENHPFWQKVGRESGDSPSSDIQGSADQLPRDQALGDPDPGEQDPADQGLSRAPLGTAPNIIFLFIESFNANYVNATEPESGKIFTPYFNQLLKEGFYSDRFYGNSIQTSRGLFAAFCSLLPSFKDKVFSIYGDTHFRCLPEILREHGYQTHFFQAYGSTGFGSKGTFLKKNGFDWVDSVANHMKPGDKAHIWGWGLQDDIYYKRFFQYINEKQSQSRSEKDKASQAEGERKEPPFFASLLTVSSHMQFRDLPDDQKEIFPGYSGHISFKNYGNVIHAVDKYLKTFFEELSRQPYADNTLVVITGDHSFPTGEHGYAFNELGANEESFRMPFLMWGPGVIPFDFKEPLSQVDLLPTILDYLGIEDETHTIGLSVFSEEAKESRPVLLVQPYDGLILSVVRGSMKYSRHFLHRKEVLYDLSKDPKESENLAEDEEYQGVLNQMRDDLGWIYLNQKYLEDDLFVPKVKDVK